MNTSIVRLITLYEYISKYDKTRVITLKALQDHLYRTMDEYTCSGKTISRDLEQMRDELGINVQYVNGRYHIVPYDDEEISYDVNRFLAFSKIVNKVSELHKQALSKIRGINLEASNSFDSHWANVAKILPHIWKKQIIVIHHKNYGYENTIPYKVQPLYIIERSQRWYLVAKYKAEIRTYGLDRISEVESTEEEFALPKGFTILDKLNRLIGVAGINDNPETFTVRFTNHQALYETAYPWHPDYTISQVKEGYTDYTYTLILNYELKRKILSYGAAIEVLEPEHLRKDIISQINAAKEIYK